MVFPHCHHMVEVQVQLKHLLGHLQHLHYLSVSYEMVKQYSQCKQLMRPKMVIKSLKFEVMNIKKSLLVVPVDLGVLDVLGHL